MKRMNDFFNVNELDLLTEDEKKFNENYVKKLTAYSDGKVDGVHIRNLTAGAATIAKRQQSRSAIAMLKFNIAIKGDSLPVDSNKQVEDKGTT